MAILSGSFSKALLPGITKFFGMEYKDFPEFYSQFMSVISGTQAFNDETLFTGLGLPDVRSEGQPGSYQDTSQGWTKRYTQVEYFAGFIVSRIAVEDDKAGVISQIKSKALARAMKQGMEYPAHAVIANAFNNATAWLGGDGKELCSTTHPLKSGGTFSNRLAADADLTEASIEDMLVQLKGWVDDAGLKINVMPDRLVIPTSLEYEAYRYLKSTGRVGTADNDINAINSMGVFKRDPLVTPYLSDTDAFFITTDCMQGLQMIVRRQPSVEQDGDFDTDNAKYKSTMRFSVGFTNPRCIIGTPGA